MTLLAALFAALVLAFAPAAQAGSHRTTAKWRNCDTFKAGIVVRATFGNVAAVHGKGRYMVKRWIEWEYFKGGTWKEADRHHSESRWVKVTNPDYDWVTSVGDRTGWQGLYYSHWRAKVTVKLIKNRPGPRDKKVDVVQIFPMKGSFREVGSNCGYEF